MTTFSWLCCFPKKAKMRAFDSPEMDLKKPEPVASFDMVFPTREQFLESCKSQAFSLPIHIMEYIWKNPSSPEVYEKLIKSCKLFFLKNPILVINNLEYRFKSEWQYCKSKECGEAGHKHKYKIFNMDEYEGKIWATGKLVVCTKRKSKIAADLIPKMYRNDIKDLSLTEQIFTYDELKFLASGVEHCFLGDYAIKYDNGGYIPSEEIIKLFSGAKSVRLHFNTVTSNAACKSYADFVDACSTVGKVYYYCVSVNFDVREIYQQMKRSKSHALICICSGITGDHFDEVTEEILGTEVFEFVPPVIITYFGQDRTKWKKMEKIQAREAAKYR